MPFDNSIGVTSHGRHGVNACQAHLAIPATKTTQKHAPFKDGGTGRLDLGCKVEFSYRGMRGTGMILDREICDHGRGAIALILHGRKRTWIPRDNLRGLEPEPPKPPEPEHLQRSPFKIGDFVCIDHRDRTLFGNVTWINPDGTVAVDVQVAGRRRPKIVFATSISKLAKAVYRDMIFYPPISAEDISGVI